MVYNTFNLNRIIKTFNLFYKGMWGWQAGATGATAVANNVPPHPHSGHPQELSDMMMQMLDQSAAAASFEDLNMFNTNFE